MNGKRPTISDIAALAGVSVATVDRVLSDRAKVSHQSTVKVLGALRALGMAGRLPPGARDAFRFDVILALEDETFFERYQRAFLHRGASHGVQVRISRAGGDERQLPRLLTALLGQSGRCHGLVVIGKNTPAMQSQIASLALAGIPTVLLLSPMEAAGSDYIGIDNYAAGRTAGYLLGAFLGGRGTALLITHTLDFPSHQQRVRGFTDLCGERYPAIAIVGPLECHDTAHQCHAAVAAQMAAGIGFDGIYHTGAGSEGVASALAGRTVRAWVAHELTPVNAALLKQGAISVVLDQDVELQVEAAIEELLYRNGIIEQAADDFVVPFHVVTPENAGGAARSGRR